MLAIYFLFRFNLFSFGLASSSSSIEPNYAHIVDSSRHSSLFLFPDSRVEWNRRREGEKSALVTEEYGNSICSRFNHSQPCILFHANPSYEVHIIRDQRKQDIKIEEESLFHTVDTTYVNAQADKIKEDMNFDKK